jgi:hypothetical protein
LRLFLATSLLGRLGFSMLPLGVVLFARGVTGSFGAAGAVAAACALASAFHPLRGAVVDRYGGVALAAFALACAVALGGLVGVGLAVPARGWLIAAAVLVGAATPPQGPFARARWGAALGADEHRVQRALAADAALEEGAFVIGPLLVSALVASASSAAALGLAGALIGLGGVTSALVAPAARSDGAVVVDADGGGAAPSAGALSTLVLALITMLGAALALGSLDVALPAFATHHGAAAAAGILIAALSAGAAVGGLLYGTRAWRWPLERRFAALACLFAVALVPPIFAPSIGVLAALMLLPGLALGPLYVALYGLVGRHASARRATLSYGWVVSANNAGAAGGAAAAGALVSGQGARAGLELACAAALLGALLSLLPRTWK